MKLGLGGKQDQPVRARFPGAWSTAGNLALHMQTSTGMWQVARLGADQAFLGPTTGELFVKREGRGVEE